MQCSIMIATIAALALGATASPVQAPAAWMFKYCDDTGLGGKCAEKTDSGNLQVCEDLTALSGATPKSIKTYSGFDCWTYKDANCNGLAARYVVGTYDNPAAFKTWRCYSA
ncbi:hypothetical protein PG994_012704 [Apiospora phragmitis]|uniref:Uncharacterized protein n=1 Tax=Apiospora phragmitis TaxID=2905665 RepID=A0ABR1TD11_9PEZI